MPQLIGTHPTTDMPVYREFGRIIADDKQEVISIEYDEWQELPNGSVMPKSMERKRYHVKDKPAITETRLKEGSEEEYEQIVLVPATDRFSQWANGNPDASKSRRQEFRDAINQTLMSLPIGFPDGGII
jgi:hypothetical protein